MSPICIVCNLKGKRLNYKQLIINVIKQIRTQKLIAAESKIQTCLRRITMEMEQKQFQLYFQLWSQIPAPQHKTHIVSYGFSQSQHVNIYAGLWDVPSRWSANNVISAWDLQAPIEESVFLRLSVNNSASVIAIVLLQLSNFARRVKNTFQQ